MRRSSMWLVRFCSILMLVVTLLLPPGLFRDCCCARRQSVEQSRLKSLPACCKARLLAQQIAQKKSGRAEKSSMPTLKALPCQCKIKATSTNVALLRDQSRDTVESDQWMTDALPVVVSSVTKQMMVDNVWHSPRDLNAAEIPLRKTLCRWVI